MLILGFASRRKDGGGWTLVRIDDHVDKSSIRSKHAVGSMPDTLSCNGSNQKFSDEFIIALWTEKLRYTAKISFDAGGEMNYESETNIKSFADKHFTGKCGNSNVIKPVFLQLFFSSNAAHFTATESRLMLAECSALCRQVGDSRLRARRAIR